MSKFVYVQFEGVEKALRIGADDVEECGHIGHTGYALSLKRDGVPVGKLKADSVVGWWIEDETPVPRAASG